MNLLPIPDDPPVTMTAPKGARNVFTRFTELGSLRSWPTNQKKGAMNKSHNSHELILSGIHVELTESMKSYAREKVEKLFRHEEQIVRIRIEIESDQTASKSDKFTAKGHVQIQGPDINISVSSDDAYKSIDLLADKLDRGLRRRSRLRKVKRNHPHSVEITDMLPKAV
jgi:putative sigma-54 modulation protein